VVFLLFVLVPPKTPARAAGLKQYAYSTTTSHMHIIPFPLTTAPPLPLFVNMADAFKLQLSKLRTWLDRYPVMKTVEEKTHVPKEYAICGAGFLVFLFLLFSNGAGFLWCVGGGGGGEGGRHVKCRRYVHIHVGSSCRVCVFTFIHTHTAT